MEGIAENSRFWAHGLRPGYAKFGPRVDFTETLLFQAAEKMTASLGGMSLNSSFYLND